MSGLMSGVFHLLISQCFLPGTLLTIVWLMQALDPVQHHSQVLAYIDKLKEVDPMREQFYIDLSKICLCPKRFFLHFLSLPLQKASM
jgi:hypothetical protein